MNIKDISEDGDGSGFMEAPIRLQVPRPWNYFAEVPWLDMDKEKLDEAIKNIRENEVIPGKHMMTIEMEWLKTPKEVRQKRIKDWIEKEVSDINYRMKGSYAI